MNIGELFIELGFKADTLKLKDFMHAVGDLNISSIATALGLGTLYEATSKIMDISSNAGMEMYNFAQQTGLSAQEMEQFKKVVEEAGGSAQEAEGFVRKMREEMGLRALGQAPRMAGLWQLLGIDPGDYKSIPEFMDKASERWKALTKEARIGAVAMGLVSEGMSNVWETQGKISERTKFFKVISPEQVKALHEFHSSLVDIKQEFIHIVQSLGADMAPALSKFNGFLGMALQHTDLLKVAFWALAAAITLAGTAIKGFMLAAMPWLAAVAVAGMLGASVGGLVRKTTNVDEKLSGNEGLLTRLYMAIDKLQGRTAQGSDRLTGNVTVNVNGTLHPETVAERITEMINKRDRNGRRYGDNSNPSY